MWVCASHSGKPYSSVERRKPIAGKSPRRRCGFAPHTRESLVSPLMGANFLPGKSPTVEGVCASYPGKPYYSVEGRKPFAGKSPRRRSGFAPHPPESLILPLKGAKQLPGRAPGVCVGLRLTPGKALLFRRGAQTNCREKAPVAVRVCASPPGKPYYSVEGRKAIAGKSPRRLCGFAPHPRESLIIPSRGANQLPGRVSGGGVGLRPIPGKALFFR